MSWSKKWQESHRQTLQHSQIQSVTSQNHLRKHRAKHKWDLPSTAPTTWNSRGTCFLFDPSSGEKTPFRFVNSVKRYFACWIGWEWYASLSGTVVLTLFSSEGWYLFIYKYLLFLCIRSASFARASQTTSFWNWRGICFCEIDLHTNILYLLTCTHICEPASAILSICKPQMDRMSTYIQYTNCNL